MKITKFINYLLIALFVIPFFSIFNCAESYEEYTEFPEIDSVMFVNFTLLNEYQAKVVMTHHYSFNKTYLKNLSSNINSLNITINLGIKIILNNSEFIRRDEAIAETSLGEMKIAFFNESILDTEQINYSLFVNETIFYKITYYVTGFAWGVPSIDFIRIPLNFNLNNKNICHQELNVKIILPYDSIIDKNHEKYITFYGFSIEDSNILSEKFIDKMLSGDPLTLFYSKNQIGKELTLFPFIDYYTSEVPKIEISYNHEYSIIDNRMLESLMIQNKNNYSLFLAYDSSSEEPFYTLISGDEIENYDTTYIFPPTSGSSYNLYDNKKISTKVEKNDLSLFGHGKFSFPIESYEIVKTKKMKVNFYAKDPTSFFVNYNFELKSMNLFKVDKEKSFYSISPTKIMIPPIFSNNQELIKDKSLLWINDFKKDVSGVRILIDIIPSEYNKDVNESIYRLYSTWCVADTKRIDNESHSYYLFEDSNFEVTTMQNEITISYNLIYSTKSDIQLICLVLMLVTPFLVLGCLLSTPRSKKQKIIKYIVFIGILGTILYSLLSLRPEGYPFTIFDLIIFIDILLGVAFSFIIRKLWKKPICPNCKKNSYVRKRKIKKPKWICDDCDFQFDNQDLKNEKG